MNILKTIWKQWLKIGKKIGNFQAQVIFTLFYFFILWPIGIIVRISSDPLRLKKPLLPSNYSVWEHPVDTINEARKQY